MKSIVEITSLEITAGRGGKMLIHDFSTTLHAGDLIALVGLNGSGKSTLLLALSGLTLPSKGKIEINSQNLHQLTAHEKSRLSSIVFTSQENIPWMDVYSFISSGRAPYTSFNGKLSSEDEKIIDKYISQTGLENLQDRYVHTLSDGEKQRCLIARALVQDTPFILLDEPTAFLDIRNKKQMMELLSDLSIRNNKVILFSTHDIQLSKKYAKMIWFLDNQKIKTVSPGEFNEEVFH